MPHHPSMSTPPSALALAESPTLPDALAASAAIPGWLTQDQATVLFTEAAALMPGSRIVEIGSHQGRSTVVLALANPSADVTAVDAFTTTRRYAGPSVESQLRANLERVGVADRVTVIPARSREVRETWEAPIDLLYIDGKHDVVTVTGDLAWTEFLSTGSHVLVHDAFSSVGVTLALIGRVLPSRRIRYLDRTGSLARFEIGRPTPADRSTLLAQLPWWMRNVGIKVLLRARLRAVAARAGHRDDVDPY